MPLKNPPLAKHLCINDILKPVPIYKTKEGLPILVKLLNRVCQLIRVRLHNIRNLAFTTNSKLNKNPQIL